MTTFNNTQQWDYSAFNFSSGTGRGKNRGESPVASILREIEKDYEAMKLNPDAVVVQHSEEVSDGLEAHEDYEQDGYEYE